VTRFSVALPAETKFPLGANVALSPDGNYVLVGGQFLGLWDAQSGSFLNSLVGHTDIVETVAFSSDGKRVLSGSADQTARLWDAETRQELSVFTGHTGAVLAVAFSPNGKYILTGSRDQTARLWDAETGQQLRIFAGHADSVIGVAFSPDGKYVLTGSEDGTARLWDADYRDAIRFACSLLVRDLSDEERAQYGIADDGPTCP
jgi:WD40 repeat protein